MIANEPFRCLFHKEGCDWRGTIGTDDRILQEHLRTCAVAGYKPCEACGQVVGAVQMAQHLSDTCPERSITCKHCHESMHASLALAHRVLGEHTHNPCIRTEHCRFKCGAIVLRTDMPEHCRVACTKRLVPCQVCPVADMHLVEWRNLAAHYREKITSVDTAVAALAMQAWNDSCAEWGRFEVGEVLDAQDRLTKKWAVACIVDKRRAPNALQHNLVFDEIRIKWLATNVTSEWQSLDTTRGYAPYNKFTRPTLVAISGTSEVGGEHVLRSLASGLPISPFHPARYAYRLLEQP
jgi:hypothetical protein